MQTNLIGQIVFAQPSDRSRPLEAFICTGQGNDRAGCDTYLELVSTRGGLLSSQVEVVPLSSDKGGFTIAGYQDAIVLIRQIIDELTMVLTNTSLTLTEPARREATNTRSYLADALAHRCRLLLREEREAEDAKIAAQRALEDRALDQSAESLAADPGVPQPEDHTVRIIIAGPPDFVEGVRNQLRNELPPS